MHSILIVPAFCRIVICGMRSCQMMPKMICRQQTWKSSSFFYLGSIKSSSLTAIYEEMRKPAQKGRLKCMSGCVWLQLHLLDQQICYLMVRETQDDHQFSVAVVSCSDSSHWLQSSFMEIHHGQGETCLIRWSELTWQFWCKVYGMLLFFFFWAEYCQYPAHSTLVGVTTIFPWLFVQLHLMKQLYSQLDWRTVTTHKSSPPHMSHLQWLKT